MAKSGHKPEKVELFDDELANAIDSIADILGGTDSDENNWKAIKLVENDEVVGKTVPEDKKSAIETLVKAANKNADGGRGGENRGLQIPVHF